MADAVFIGDIVESNGKTIKENNFSLKHEYPIMSQVKVVSYDSWLSRESEVIQNAVNAGLPFYVVQHIRDCDGTPLYAVSFVPLTAAEDERLNEKYLSMVSKDRSLRADLSAFIQLTDLVKTFTLFGMHSDDLERV
ncbi:hypothetical protein DZF72_07650 [Vibrio parahaemolyticus]|uniref:Uncharacterized protein n=1 Tax=Vibrio fluvialis PG41 TaxID=1336752 RepID=S7I0Y8_VIBFL|nr:hypothetical protein [Vibrio fluvialis]EGR2217563.1 hypothetical protein [Vibrio parahaemolyticus]EPP21577.1 hypothetical protein L910_1256 [Vibrio fluvialis PG41]TBT51391.1 hypothetical protein D5E78_06230 [Vibrio parahaemolyticus]